ncbi:MAG: hypothetical protein JO017_01950 [Actinobacteria bacterium]|nr:hypothetical protein [Actinomycetota bacterium]
MRDDLNGGGLNSIPAVTYGAWSPIYTSTNPPITGGAMKLVGTVSDVFSNGSAGSPAHKLMPAFLWTGNQTLDGTAVELYRLYIFTDKECLNTVFTSAVIGSPAYSPRPMGPLALPSSTTGVAAARSSYLADGSEPPSLTYDGQTVTTSESAAPAAPTTSVPGSPGASTGGSTTTTTTTTTPATGGSSSAGSTTPGSLTVSGNLGAPIDLWDTNWPSSGYYWTVVGVAAEAAATFSTTVGSGGALAGATTLTVTTGSGFNVGDTISIGAGPNAETAVITALSGNVLTLAGGLKFGHGAGEAVSRSGGSLTYQDLELPQDVCAAGRVMRFGKASEPSLTSSGQLFATGLSSDGRLTSALHTTSFYGQPLVSWTPALGAEAYEVQWSKTSYPFNPELTAAGSPGFMTAGTSAVLPVSPGTWYYRVRGFDYSLPTGAQQMSWSDPAKLVVATPKFKIVTASTTPAPKKKK